MLPDADPGEEQEVPAPFATAAAVPSSSSSPPDVVDHGSGGGPTQVERESGEREEVMARVNAAKMAMPETDERP